MQSPKKSMKSCRKSMQSLKSIPESSVFETNVVAAVSPARESVHEEKCKNSEFL